MEHTKTNTRKLYCIEMNIKYIYKKTIPNYYENLIPFTWITCRFLTFKCFILCESLIF